MTPSTVRLTATENVYVGERAGTAIKAEAERLGAKRVFLLVSRSLNNDTDEIEQMVAKRSEARSRKDWARADEIRNRLQDMGVVLKDGPQGTTWRLDV